MGKSSTVFSAWNSKKSVSKEEVNPKSTNGSIFWHLIKKIKLNFKSKMDVQNFVIAGSLESAYSLNWGAREIWGKGGGETLALLW